jgi:hypothetical protein
MYNSVSIPSRPTSHMTRVYWSVKKEWQCNLVTVEVYGDSHSGRAFLVAGFDRLDAEIVGSNPA